MNWYGYCISNVLDNNYLEVATVSTQKTESQLMSLVFKGMCLILVGILAVIGVIGLVLPIIPGILFLFLAAILLAKISSRFDSLLNKNKDMRYWRRRWNTTNALPLIQRIKLSFWVVARAIVNGVEAGISTLRKNHSRG